jgi:hypothetical protein
LQIFLSLEQNCAMRNSVFQLPDELILTTLNQTFPCRETQIRTLATLLSVRYLGSVIINNADSL